MRTEPAERYPDKEAWFRSSDWGGEVRAQFEGRLARARAVNRVQYRRIKATALLATDDPPRQAAGRELFEDNLRSDDAADHEKVIALASLSAHDQAIGRLDDAERHLREALRVAGPTGLGTNGEEEIRLAEILLEQGGPIRIAEAKDLLDRRAADMPRFVRSQFRLCVAQARVSLALGDEAAVEWAEAALRLARESQSGLANHPLLGLVDADADTLAWLNALISKGR